MADKQASAAEKVSAAARYAQLKPLRSTAESRFRRCAAVTLPRLYVTEGQKNRKAPTAYTDTGPKCVNSLSAKIVLAWLPPGASIVKLSPDNAVKDKMAEQAGVSSSEVESALAEVERAVVNDIETSGCRSVLSEAVKHALVSGNFLFYDPDDGPPKYYPLTSYVVARDGLGNVLEIITLDKIAPTLLPDNVRAAVMQKIQAESNGSIDKMEEDVDLYTRISRSEDNKKWEVIQEVKGFEIPQTAKTYDIDACPWMVVAVPRSSYSDYGEGIVYDYVGAFESLEGIRKAVRKGAAAVAKIILLLKPGSPLREKHLQEAQSGDILRGNRDDVSTLQLDKTMELNFARQEADAIKTSLEVVFGVKSAIQRPGERVTATEMRLLSQELDDNLGGFYAITTEDLMLPLVKRRIAKMTAEGRLPEIPPELMKPRMTVGMAALGRGHDLEKLRVFGEAGMAAIGQQEMARRINAEEYLFRIAAASDISTKGLIYTDEQLQQQQQNNSMNEAAVRAAPQLVQGMLQPQQEGAPQQ